MSNFRAIAGVSVTLQALLRDRMQLPPGVVDADLQITISNPKTEGDPAVEAPRVNLFLFRVVENGFLKNQEIPGQGHPGTYGHPPLSVNLYYLLTAYGTTTEVGGALVNESRAHELLGSAMRVLHDYPVVTESLVTVKAPAGRTILDESLRQQFEQVKITLEPVSLEDVSKVWTALTLPYRLSVAYQVSVVQIDTRLQRRLASPVRTRRIHLAAFRRPQIASIYRTPTVPGEPIGDARAGVLQEITIEGANFTGTAVQVRIGSLNPIPVTPDNPERIRVTLPDDPLLQPGPQLVQVLVERETEVVEGGLDHGKTVLDHNVLVSNQSVFMLVPVVNTASPAAGAAAGTVLALTGKRLFRDGLKCSVLVGNVLLTVRPPAGGEVFPPPTETAVSVPLAPVAEALPPLAVNADYPVHAVVNGAESVNDTLLFHLNP